MDATYKPLPRAYRPSVARVPGCTHITLTRKFTTSKNEVCDLCHQPPSLGWLYRCTQDSGGFLPEWDFYDTEVLRLESDAQLYTLSESILAAAHKGHYTDAELSILWKQKSMVRDSVRQLRPYPPSLTSSTISSSQYSLSTSSTFSTVHSYDSQTDSDLESSCISDQHFVCRTALEPIHEVVDESSEEELELVQYLPHSDLDQSHMTVCHHQVCQRCRPSYRERSYHSIYQVMLSGTTPPKHELENKKVSPASLLSNLDYTPADTEESEHTGSVVETDPQELLQQVSTCHNIASLVIHPITTAAGSQS